MGRDLGIDGIRGLAILGVVIYHAACVAGGNGGEWHSRWGIGAVGVPVFFVVSGYLVALPWVRWCLGQGKEPSLLDYWRRRILRLEPPWLICFAVYWLCHQWWACPWTAEHVLPTVLYQHQLTHGTMSPLTPHSWSLELEIRWYAAAPFVAMCMSWPRALRRGALLAAIVLLGSWPAHFLIGMLVADLRLSGERLPGWASAVALLSILPARAVGFDVHCLTALALMSPPRLGAVVEALGLRCYSVYLFHMLGQAFVPAPENAWLAVAWLTVAGLAAGLLAWRLVELPARALLTRRGEAPA